jgi:hypothetical protein
MWIKILCTFARLVSYEDGMMTKIHYKTQEEFLLACNEQSKKGDAYRTEANPEKNEYWIEVRYIKGEIVRKQPVMRMEEI